MIGKVVQLTKNSGGTWSAAMTIGVNADGSLRLAQFEPGGKSLDLQDNITNDVTQPKHWREVQ